MTLLDDVFQKSNGAIDPVCEMEVDVNLPPGGTSIYKEVTYYFCGVGCRQTFEIDPTKFVSE